MEAATINTILLIVANIFLGAISFGFKVLFEFIKETRRKLDKHVEDFNVHGFSKE